MTTDGDGLDGVGARGDGKLERLIQQQQHFREELRLRDQKRQAARERLTSDQRRWLDTAIVHLNGIIDASRRLGHTALYQELELVVQDIRDAGGS